MCSIRELAKTPVFQIFKKDQNNYAMERHLAEIHLEHCILADFFVWFKTISDTLY